MRVFFLPYTDAGELSPEAAAALESMRREPYYKRWVYTVSTIKIAQFPEDDPKPASTGTPGVVPQKLTVAGDWQAQPLPLSGGDPAPPDFWAMGCGAVLAAVIAAVSLGVVAGLFAGVGWLVFRWLTGG
jgi:hypothetical protein